MNTHGLFASAAVAAVFAFGVPAHAQLLGGAAGGALGGAVGGGFGPIGGAINGNGWGMMRGPRAGSRDGLTSLRGRAAAAGQSARGAEHGAVQRKNALAADAGRLAGKGRDAAASTTGSAPGRAVGTLQWATNAQQDATGPAIPYVSDLNASRAAGGALAGMGRAATASPSGSGNSARGRNHGRGRGHGSAHNGSSAGSSGSEGGSGLGHGVSGAASAQGGASVSATSQH
jgi:hypothetical protein